MVYWSFYPIDPAVDGRLHQDGARPHHAAGDHRRQLGLLAERTEGRSSTSVDFAAVHTYPLLDTVYDPTPLGLAAAGDVPAESRAAAMMDAAIACGQERVQRRARATSTSKGQAAMPIVIGETGWKAVDRRGAGSSAPTR